MQDNLIRCMFCIRMRKQLEEELALAQQQKVDAEEQAERWKNALMVRYFCV
jgi:hypothetical protein